MKFRHCVSPPYISHCQGWALYALCRAIDEGVGGQVTKACGINRNARVVFFYWRLLFEVQERRTVSPLSTHEVVRGLFHAVHRAGSIRGFILRHVKKSVESSQTSAFGSVNTRVFSFPCVFSKCENLQSSRTSKKNEIIDFRGRLGENLSVLWIFVWIMNSQRKMQSLYAASISDICRFFYFGLCVFR